MTKKCEDTKRTQLLFGMSLGMKGYNSDSSSAKKNKTKKKHREHRGPVEWVGQKCQCLITMGRKFCNYSLTYCFFFLISSSIISAGLFTSVCGHFYIFNRIIIKAALMMLNKRYLFVCHDCPWFFFLSVWLNNKISLRGEQHTESHTGSLRKRKKNTDN